MNLTIKDLSTSTELDCEAMSAVRGGTYANSAVQSILQAQDVMVPVANGSYFGAGSATNIDVDVDAEPARLQPHLAIQRRLVRDLPGLVPAPAADPAPSFTPSTPSTPTEN